jgi:hypothetical protein
MRHDRLRLVAPEDRAAAATERSTELSAVTARPDSGIARLRLPEADEGAPPDDAA